MIGAVERIDERLASEIEEIERGIRREIFVRWSDGEAQAVIRGRCPLCVLNSDSKDEVRGLDRDDASLLLPGLGWYCMYPACPSAGYGAAGMPYQEWRQLFAGLRDERPDDPAADTGRSSTTTTKAPAGAIGLIEATGRFFNLEGETVFVRNDGGEPLHVPSKAFAAHANKVLRAKDERVVRFRETLDTIVEHAHLNGVRAQLEFVTGRAADGAPLIHLGSGLLGAWRGDQFHAAKNGADGVVFRTEQDFLALVPSEVRAARRSALERFPAFHEAVLDELPPSSGLLTVGEMRALLLATWLATFLRPWGTARPITLLLGPPGCGKTTTQRLFAVAFFGPDGEVGGGASLDRVSKDLLAGAVHQSLVVRDDVTDLSPGGIDALCRTATGTKAKLAEFHQTLKLVSYRARAQLVLSAVVPSWLSRADIVSRLWLIEFAAAAQVSRMTERERVERVLAARPAIWAETTWALRLLALPLPQRSAISRFDSFEQAVFPIVAAAGYGAAFESALRKMPEIGAVVAARADPIIGYMLALAHAVRGRWLTAAQLADELARVLGARPRDYEPHLASGITRDPLRLGHLLGKLEREGSAVITVEGRSAHNHQREWRLTPRVAGGNGGEDPDLDRDLEEEGRPPNSEASGRTVESPPTPPAQDQT